MSLVPRYAVPPAAQHPACFSIAGHKTLSVHESRAYTHILDLGDLGCFGSNMTRALVALWWTAVDSIAPITLLLSISCVAERSISGVRRRAIFLDIVCTWS